MKKKQILFLILIFSLILFACSNTNEQNQTIELNGNWKFTSSIYKNFLPASVPGSVHTDLFTNQLIPDPFIGSNENDLQWVDTLDWIYVNEFSKPANVNKNDLITFIFKGLDTYTKIYLNDSLLTQTNNMFLQYEATVNQKELKEKNFLKIIFESTSNKEKRKYEKSPYKFPEGPRALTRKAAYQYGWDWAPKYVSSGIWQPVEMKVWKTAKINQVAYKINNLDSTNANITIEASIHAKESFSGTINLICKNKNIPAFKKRMEFKKGIHNYSFTLKIKDPELWWTHNLGEPFLYDFDINLIKDHSNIESQNLKVGLRTIELVQETDKFGESFYFKLNGFPVFMKGANYVPQNSFPGVVTNNQYKQLISDVKEANMNMLRVWGGGIYEKDIFYDLCDETGILIWQDFMFANNMYPSDKLFIENIKKEAEYQVQRLRKHPSIALWCGNNEIDEAWHNWGWSGVYSIKDSAEIWENYKNIFHHILPNIVKENNSKISYTSSSPLFGRGNPRSSFEGDNHYWYVWHDAYDFDWYNKVTGRFMSEFGFQSYPSLETIEYFDSSEFHTTDSEIMQAHQKHHKGNFLINHYMKDYYPVPEDFDDFVYVSQVLQAEGIRTGILAQRRAKPFCMGSLFWQLNDCWPAISWSSIDYSGNWKALHYFAQKDFKNVIVNPYINKDSLHIYIVSDSLKAFSCELKINLMSMEGEVINSEILPIQVNPNSSEIFYKKSIEKIIATKSLENHFFLIQLLKEQKTINSRAVLLCKPKNLKLKKAELFINTESIPEGYLVTFSSNQLIKNVYLELPFKGKWSDNFFDLIPGIEKKVKFKTNIEIENISEKIKYNSLNQILTENKN